MVDFRLECARKSCSKCATLNFEGSDKPEFCDQHAWDNMANIRICRCPHHTCVLSPTFNLKGSKGPVFSKNHAEDGMVKVLYHNQCSYGTCVTSPNFGTKDSKTPAFCKQRAGGGMVNMSPKRSTRADDVPDRATGKYNSGASAKRAR